MVREQDQITFLSIKLIGHNSTGAYEMGGQIGLLSTQVLADQLTLYQPEGADVNTPEILAHPASYTPNNRYT